MKNKLIMKNKFKMLYIFIYVAATILCLTVFLCYDYSAIKTFKYLFLINMFILIAYIDYKKMIIPNLMLLIMLGGRLVFLLFEYIFYKDMIASIIVSSFTGLVVGCIVFLIAFLLVKESLGMGDVKLMGVVGFYVGISDLFSCMILSLLISLIAGIFLILSKKMTSKDCIAFAPFLALGTVLTLLFRL